jgi:hypothetical protein
MRYTTLSAVSLSCLFLAACDKDPAVATTGPDIPIRLAWAATDACNARLGRAVTAEQKNLFARPTLDEAKTRWGRVTAACGTDGSGARDLMLEYVRFTILAELNGRVLPADHEQAIVDHWDLVFPYVGYGPPDLDRVVLTDAGAARVILETEGSTSNNPPAAPEIADAFGIPRKAAMTFYKQWSTGDQRGHLFTIAPLPQQCLSTNLAQDGDCYEFSSFPSVTTSTAGAFDPRVKLGICYEGGARLPALGHGVNNQTEVPESTAGSYPSSAFCHNTEPLPQFGGIFGPFRNLAYRASSLLSVRKAYAAHGGLGGLSDDLSPFGVVDLQVFVATFDGLAPGTTPTVGPPSGPEVGSWIRAFADPPGSILVQSSVGDLLTNPVVLSQGGGACALCGGLDLWGQLNSSAPGVYATNGVYKVTWESLQSGPSLKKAPFVLRSSPSTGNPAGDTIAIVEYSQQSGTNYLKFNGQTLDVRWVRNEKLKFEITVDLDEDLVSLKINDSDALPTAFTQDIPFNAPNFATVRAEFSGIDSGTMVWDNIIVVRLPGH